MAMSITLTSESATLSVTVSSSGTQGPIGVNWLGEWSGATQYSVRDAVTYQGSTYYALQTGTDKNPVTETAYWAILARGVYWRAAWSGATAYLTGDAVSYAGASYYALQAGTNKNPTTEPTYWGLMAARGDDYPSVYLSGAGPHAPTLGQAGSMFWLSHTAANVFTIPANATVAFPVGTKLSVIQEGAGITTIQAAAGVTLNGVTPGGVAIWRQYGAATLVKRAENTWVIFGAVGVVA